ncbi:CCA tRNA nucleotidyltransferase [Rubinisphaera margarita]|uniref:CCA tRNA nucleotidyltransferase n=1 Tax=Rubinisphaera margarita TaxID=2909586 RepID=UPI001EE90E49|nr:CCA tRNA nucleotidyltransferase [Rubinisphaera margarita]MCG6156112.1 hypothetical protein [Rubinisphaera margarita]
MLSDSQRQFALRIVDRLADAGFEAYWAGGCVRDLLMNIPPKDYDVATSATPEQVRTLFGKRSTLAIGESFGVIVVIGPRDESGEHLKVEVATFRTDGSYSDGRRPDTVTFSSPREDALRRDYTINGMFYDPIRKGVLDYVGGQEDLKRRVIRSIGDPAARIAEDKLRMLRAVRFTARFDFELDSATAAAICHQAAELKAVSPERIAQELRATLAHPNRARACELLISLGLMPVILPELAPIAGSEYWAETITLWRLQKIDSFELALAILLRGLHGKVDPDSSARSPDTMVESICRRLRLSNRECDEISWLVEHQQDLDDAANLPLHLLKTLLHHRSRDLLLEWTRVRAVGVGQESSGFDFCEHYLQSTPPERLDPPPCVTGADLISAGLRPGPEFSEMLARVRRAQLDEQIRTREEGLELLGLQND